MTVSVYLLRLLAATAWLAFLAPPVLAQDLPQAPAAPPGDVLPGLSPSIEPAVSLPPDLSPWGMFIAADWVVQAVMIGLAFASLVTWTVLIAKSLGLREAIVRERRTLVKLDDVYTIDEAADRVGRKGGGAASFLLAAAIAELRQSKDVLDDRDGVKERVVSRLERIEAIAARRIGHGLGILATIGATAPFVGLFGTVWGIMNSFIGIAASGTTNLAVVAPGIAEALLATALGLVAAIPAVVVYNHFSRRIGAYRGLVADSSAAVLRLVSRDLSRRVTGRSTLKIAAE